MKTGRKLTWLILVLIAFAWTMNGCKTGKKETQEKAGQGITKDSIKQAVQQVVYPLPSPFEVHERLKDIGASYLGDVLNSTGNVDQYFTRQLKAINIGVYSADLSYVITYNRTEEIQEYTRTIGSIRKDLDIQLDYPDYNQQELKEKLQQKDSLVNFIAGIFEKTYSYLEQKDSPALAALMISGIWAEGLYIATHISEDTYNNYEIVKVIYDQKSSLKKVVSLLNEYKTDEDVALIHEAFNDLLETYENAGTDISRSELEAITSKIAKIRESMVS